MRRSRPVHSQIGGILEDLLREVRENEGGGDSVGENERGGDTVRENEGGGDTVRENRREQTRMKSGERE